MKAINREVGIRTATEGQAVSLLGVHVESRIAGLIEKTTVTQSFRNDEDEAIEVTYTFPLPANATVCGFEIITNDHVLTGKSKARDEAVQDYDEAITQGDGAFLLEKHRPDVFTVNVGNIKSGQLAVLKIAYIRLLKQADHQLELSFPTTVPPRYVTDTGTVDTSAVMTDGEMINPLRGVEVPYGLILDLQVDASLPVLKAESESHALAVMPTQTSQAGEGVHEYSPTVVRLAKGQVAMDRDVIVTLTLAPSTAPVSITQHWNGQTFAAVSFLPDYSLLDVPMQLSASVVFVLDCSASMGGSSISQAKLALQLCLRSMKEGDHFNIVRFGSNFETFSPEMVVYSAKSLEQACHWLDKTDANLGGTELLGPLAQVCTWRNALNGNKLDVVLLTDGQVSNEAAVVKHCVAHHETHRFFTFGIGAAAGRSLCSQLSEDTGGAAEFIAPSEKIDAKVLRTFSRMESPQLHNVMLEAPTGLSFRFADNHLPTLFDGDAVCLLFRIDHEFGMEDGAGSEPSSREPTEYHAVLSAKFGEQELSWTVPIRVAPNVVDDQQAANCAVGAVWGNQYIRQLESLLPDYAGVYGANSSNVRNTQLERNIKRVEKQILELATTFNLLCDRTAFVAMEHRSMAERNAGLPAQREVPVLMPHKHGLISTDADMMMELFDMPAFMRREADSDGMEVNRMISVSKIQESAKKKEAQITQSHHESRAALLGEFDYSLGIYSVLHLQQSDGSFHGIFSHDVSDDVTLHLGEFKKTHADSLVLFAEQGSNQDAVWQTLFALHVLESYYTNDRTLWRRHKRKAHAYLRDKGLTEAQISDAVMRVCTA